MININLGERLRDLRISKNLTQKQAATRLGIAVSTLSGYELEEKHPSYYVLLKIARLYGVSTDYLLGATKNRTIDVSGLSDDEIQVLLDMIDLLRKS